MIICHSYSELSKYRILITFFSKRIPFIVFAILLLRRSAKLRIRAAQECSKFAFGYPEVASECPEVASELVGDIFEFFDLFFQGKETIRRKYYFWKI